MDKFRLKEGDEDTTSGSCLKHMTLAEWSSTEKSTLGGKLPLFMVDNDCSVESIIRAPNADDDKPDSILAAANGAAPRAVRQVPWGWLVKTGEIMVVFDNGRTSVVGPGRWAVKWNHKLFCTLGTRQSLTQDVIAAGTFTLVRVRRGQLGLALENGRPVLLQEGLHAYNNPLFSFQEFKPVDALHVKHMSYHIVRVPRGSFGKISEQCRAKLLPEGTHAVNNAVFEYCGLVSAVEAYINHGTIHIIQVPKGALGLVFESNLPRLLCEGVHLYDSPTLKFLGVRSKMDAQIVHSTISRFRVRKGEVALAHLNNEPMLIEEPGTYMVDSSNFKLANVVNTADKTIELGAKKIITANAGEVAVTYKGGMLTMLPPGRHYIDAIDHLFDGFLSTQQLSLGLTSEEEGLLTCETKDLVHIGIKADVFYRVVDPKQAILQVGREFIPELVKETSVATLNNIVRSTALGEIAQRSVASAKSPSAEAEKLRDAQATGQPSAPLFFDRAHDQFLAKLHDDFKERYGLEITNIRIEQFKIMDQALQQSIAGQAVKTAATQSELANLAGQTKIATQEQERAVRLQQTAAEAEARRSQTRADSKKAQAEAAASAQQVRSDMEANTRRTQANAEADAIRLKAQAEADAIKIQAEATVSRAAAEAEAITLTARAESERARLLSQTPLGEKLSLLEIYGDVVKKSNEGVGKVVYVDPTTTQAGNPFSLLTLQSLQKDLVQLGSTGK